MRPFTGRPRKLLPLLYLDRLRDTVWELYSDDIIDCRTPEPDEQCDSRQRHPCFEDEINPIDEGSNRARTSCNQSGRAAQEAAVRNDNNSITTPREALPSLDDLPSLSDENIGDMLNLLRALLHACEKHYKDPIRRLDEQQHQDLQHPWRRGLSKSSMTDWDDDF